LKTKIKARAASLGFPLCGITTAESPAEYRRYSAWLSNGNHAGMAYLDTEYHRTVRKDPRLLLPEVKSIIVLGLPYRLTTLQEVEQRKAGVICGYSLGEDYHHRIPQMLDPLAAFLQKLSPSASRPHIFTDSTPILERELAVRAGLGWIGKNSCLISPSHGSAFLLAEIFTDVALEPDKPFLLDHCGNCDRCIKACPTGCILPDRTIDAKRCISYHSIENRGEIPPEIINKFTNQVFGCDICQVVCPWNHFSPGEKLPEGQDNLIQAEEMSELIQIDQEEFSQLYGSTPVSRVRQEGFIRNLRIVMEKFNLHTGG